METVINPKFFVFSDDIQWVNENIELPENTVYVDFNKGNDSWQDMFIMSRCKNNIICNSTFSWWAAWLNENENKMVICPAQWMSKPSLYDKLIVDSWVCVNIDGNRF